MRLPLLLLWPLSVVLAACTSSACGLVKTGGDPILELAFIAPGDGGPVTLLRLYSGAYRDRAAAVVEMEPLGQRRRCRKVVGPGIVDLKSELRSPRFERLFTTELAKGNDLGIHEAGLSVRRLEDLVQRRLVVLSPEFSKALEPVEALFRKVFPSLTARYLPFSLEQGKHQNLTPSHAPAPDGFATGEAQDRWASTGAH